MQISIKVNRYTELCKPERFKLRIELVMIAQRVLAGADYEGK